jgi:hypothetical protein
MTFRYDSWLEAKALPQLEQPTEQPTGLSRNFRGTFMVAAQLQSSHLVHHARKTRFL